MSLPLRVLHITRDFPPQSNGGLSTAVGGLVAAQARAGIPCGVVSFDDYRPASAGNGAACEPEQASTDAGVALIRVSAQADIDRARALAADLGPELVHVHHESLWEFGAQLARHRGAPTVYTVHVLQAEQNRLRTIPSTRSSEAQQRALRECSIIHAPSQAVADLLVAEDGELAARLHLARLGHDDWPGAAAAAGASRQSDAPRLLYVGRFADINGFAEMLQSLPAIFDAHPTLRATFAGGMPDNARAERRWKRRWETLAGDSANRLDWAGWLSAPALSALYGQASMLLVPSWFETFGQVALEGMLHGTPLITTGAGALAELVDARSALLIAPKDPAAIARAVGQLLADPAATEKRRRAALTRALDGQHWDDRVQAFDDLYQSARHSLENISVLRE